MKRKWIGPRWLFHTTITFCKLSSCGKLYVVVKTTSREKTSKLSGFFLKIWYPKVFLERKLTKLSFPFYHSQCWYVQIIKDVIRQCTQRVSSVYPILLFLGLLVSTYCTFSTNQDHSIWYWNLPFESSLSLMLETIASNFVWLLSLVDQS